VGYPADTAVHLRESNLTLLLYPRSEVMGETRVRFLASRAPKPDLPVPEETRSNCWLQRLTFLKLPT
jgi:hypothetical protein